MTGVLLQFRNKLCGIQTEAVTAILEKCPGCGAKKRICASIQLYFLWPRTNAAAGKVSNQPVFFYCRGCLDKLVAAMDAL